MENFVWYPLIVFVVALSMSGTDAVTCYMCNSAIDTACKDTLTDFNVGTCTGDSCYKVTGKSGDTSVIVRNCYPTGTGSQSGCNSYNVASVSGTICTCSSDRCNAAIGSVTPGHSTSVTIRPTMTTVIVGLTLAAALMASRRL